MTKPAHAIEIANASDAKAATKATDAHPRRASEKRLSARPKVTKSTSERNAAKRDVSSPNRLQGSASTLLLGAGIGVALTLSIVAVRAKERPPTLALFSSKRSTLASALVKTAAYAVERASTRGSITNLLARAVGSSLA